MRHATRPTTTAAHWTLGSIAQAPLLTLTCVTALMVTLAACGTSETTNGTPKTDTGVATDTSTTADTDGADTTADATAATDSGASDATSTDSSSDATASCPGKVGCACTEAKDCPADSACTLGSDGKLTCAAPCKEDKDCAVGVCADVDGQKVCSDANAALCSPCSANADCAVAGAKDAACVDSGAAGNFCATACKADADCADGYACKDAKDVDGKDVKQCLPKDGKTCDCSGWATAKKLTTSCYNPGKPGCTGKRSCGDKGLTACDADAGKPEVCDGTDTDCDGTIDNGATCDDKNPCTKDSCGGKKGCQSVNDDNATCDDDNACTDKDACKDGKCTGGVKKTCDDKNPCTDDSCDPQKGCVATPNKAKCDDGNTCTEGDTCAVGLCQGVTKTCDDKNPCTDDSCDPKKGCVFLNNKVPCDDGDGCTEKDACKDGKCSGGAAKDCDDKNPCTTDVCDSKTGCKSINNLVSCDDGDMCTKSSRCKDGKCSKGVTKCSDGNPCTADTCDAKTGKCTYTSMKDGDACDDGKMCTEKDACASGKCVGKAKVCDDGKSCTTGVCDPKKGCTFTAKVCDDDDACTTDSCDETKGCQSAVTLGCTATSTVAMPYVATFKCGSANSKRWTFKNAATGPGWAVDKTPALPKPKFADCALNFNEGKYLACPSGMKKLQGSATSPEIALAAGSTPLLTIHNGGKHSNYSNKFQVFITEKGATGPKLLGKLTSPYNETSWNKKTFDLSAYAGKTVQLTLDFTTDACSFYSFTGPFVDMVKIEDSHCKTTGCDDGNPCTKDTCDATTGKCSHKGDEKATCDDGNPCTLKDACTATGSCTGTKKCDDGNTCTYDYCSTSTGKCSISLKTGACSDGDLCTAGDTCTDGICFSGALASCDDGNSCTTDACDAKTGLCSHKAVTGCAPSCKTNADCGDGDPCTIDACDTKTAKCTTKPAADGAICGAASACSKGACAQVTSTGWAIAVRSSDAAYHTCALHKDGSASCWGRNSYGQLGNGTKTNSGKPVKVKGLSDAVDIQVGRYHTCALHKDGTVSCAGHNSYRQLADGTTTSSTVLKKIPGLSDVTQLRAGGYHTCALKKSGRVWCWGDNYYGQVGIGSGGIVKQPMEVQGLTAVTSLASGQDASCAVRSDKSVWCWGYNRNYRLATGTAISSTSKLYLATRDPRYHNVVDVVLGYGNKCVRLTSGAVRCAGSNSNGQLGNGTTSYLSSKSDVANAAFAGAGQLAHGYGHAVALLPNGNAWAVGMNTYGQLGDGTKKSKSTAVRMIWLSKVIEVAAGRSHSCALRQDGTVWCTGDNYHGALGNGKTGSSSSQVAFARVVDNACATDASCRDDNTCTKQQCSLADGTCSQKALKDDVCDDGDGCTVNGKCDDKGLCQSSPKDCDDGDACTLQTTCEAGKCGYKSTVNCDDGNSCTTDACDSKTGACSHTKIAGCIIKCSDDKGCDDGDSCTVDTCVNGGCAFKAGNDGKICGAAKACAKGACAPVEIKGWARQLAMQANGRHACVLKGDATAMCWGYNNNGQVGNGDKTTQTKPVAVKGLSNIAKLAVGGYHSCALLKDGTMKCWGDNYYGQLGDGTTTDSVAPVAVKGLSGVTDLALSGSSTCAIFAGGVVKCWGRNFDGEVGMGSSTTSKVTTPTGTGLSSVKALRGGYKHFCALKTDGSTWCWGNNSYQQSVPGTSSSDVLKPTLAKGLPKATAIGVSGNGTCVATSTGAIRCIGRNFDGELGIGSKTPSDSGEKVYTPKGVSDVVQVSGGAGFKVTLDSTGHAWRWGDNSDGQLADGSKDDMVTPAKLGSPAGIVQVAGGDRTLCVLLKTGSVWCAGDSYYGTLGNGAKTDSITFKRVVDAACGSDADCNMGSACFANTCDAGTKLCKEVIKEGATCDDGDPCTVKDACDKAGMCNAEAKNCDDGNACTTSPSCDAKTGTCSQLGKIDCDDMNPCTTDSCDTKTGTCSSKPIAGCKWTCKSDADCDDGKPCTADKCLATSGVCEQKPGNDGAVCGVAGVCASGACGGITKGFAKAISSGSFGYHTCALRPNGRVYCWGRNSDGQLGDGTTSNRSKPVEVAGISDVTRIAAGDYHTCALLKSGRVNCWGKNYDGQVGNGTASSTDIKKPVEVSGLTDVIEVSAGGYHTCALKKDGSVWCWGNNSDGQIGNGTKSYTDVKKPTQAVGVSGAVQITTLKQGSCALLKSGAVMCWGNNYYTQFGAKTDDIVKPTLVAGLPKLTSIEGGTYTLGGVSATKTAWASGYNTYGLTGLGSATPNKLWPPKEISAAGKGIIAVNVGYYMTYFLDGTGQAWSVGYNYYGGLADGTTTNNLKVKKMVGGTDVVQVAARYRGGCVLKKDGSVWCVGYGSNGQLGNGTTASTNKALVKVTEPAP